MKEGWRRVRLGDAATLQRGFDLPTQHRISGTYPLVSASGISDTHHASAVDGPGVVTGRSGSVGGVFFIEEAFWPLNTVLYVKDFHGNDPKFIFHLLQSLDLRRFAGGSGVPTLNRNIVHEEFVGIPSLPEQRRVATILDEALSEIDAAVANVGQNLASAHEISKSYVADIFRNYTKDWQETTIGAEVDLLTGFAFRSSFYTNNLSGARLLRGDNIMQGELRWNDVKRWPSTDCAAYRNYELEEGDVVLAMDRTWVKAGIKLARITRNDIPALLVQRVARMRCRRTLSGGFLYHLLNSELFKSYILDIQTGLGVPHISGTQIQAFRFRRPSMSEQHKATANMDVVRIRCGDLISNYRRQLDLLAGLKRSLLHRAFAGALTIQIKGTLQDAAE